MMLLSITIKYIVLVTMVLCISLEDINLPPEHIPYFFNNFPNYGEACLKSAKCPFKGYVGRRNCWGYEDKCNISNSYHVRALCPGDHRGWVKTKQDQYNTFFTQADFGYVKDQRTEFMVMCEATYPGDTSLECSKYLRFCRGRNMMLNFTGLIGRGNNLRYKMDILGPGQIGGHCKFFPERLKNEADHMSPLQSWAPELSNFVKTPYSPIEDGKCDIVIEKPTYIMKLDASVNMYHHFCDFFNLYASLHVNSTHPSTFTKDNQILIWETFTYNSVFMDTFKAFTKNPILDLKDFRGKVACFKNVVFPLLPRMIFGLYYNTPVIYGCERSGLFHAFSKHILHSLDIKLNIRRNDKVRVTLLSRGTTYRTIVNEKEIVEALMQNEGYEVHRVVYDRSIPFRKQLEITRNTDVFIGMHGAGLTHLLFLPDWAAVFEVYNCEDPNCYADLARLRGVRYVTWDQPDKIRPQDGDQSGHGAGHAKFTNYWVDVAELLRRVQLCADHVRTRPDFTHFLHASRQATQHDEL